MNQKRIDRINELARKSKSIGLTPQEREEQAALRQEYRNAIKNNLTATLEKCVIVDENGNKKPVTAKK